MPRFVQLTAEDCTYLLNLIEEMDSDNEHTARQRLYTVPRLASIRDNPRAERLHPKDIGYLLELVADDELPEVEQQRWTTANVLAEIDELQKQRRVDQQAKDSWRYERKLKRLGISLGEQLEAASVHTTVGTE